MLLTEYTTYDEVRAALGVTVEEIEDETLALPLYADVLQVELEDLALTLPALYTSTAALVTKTEIEERFLKSAHLFATYAVAKQLTATLPMFGPEQIGDGKAVIKRFASPYKAVIESVMNDYGRFRNRLLAAFAAVNSTSAAASVTKNYFSVAAPSSDPVTGT